MVIRAQSAKLVTQLTQSEGHPHLSLALSLESSG